MSYVLLLITDFVDGDVLSLVNLGPIALFSIYKLTSSSGKHLEEINHAHIVCLMYKLLTSSRGSDDLSFGFDRSCDRRKQELTKNVKTKGKYHRTIILKDFFGLSELQKSRT